MKEFDFILFDRIEKIKQINEQYDLENNAYVSFSGGKDSTILHYLIDMALPNNKIPRLFINTGIEYSDIRKFVKTLAENDDRIVILNSGINIKEMLNKNGYPFKSKVYAHNLATYQNHKEDTELPKSIKVYLSDENHSRFRCPNILKYQFQKDFNINVSDQCCYKLKKEVAHKWAKEFMKPITITGMRKEEGGKRASIGCVLTDKSNQLVKFHPLLVVSNEWEDEFLDRFNLKLCKLYYPPYNFVRTGCKGCPFALNLQNELDKLEQLLPNERKQCEILWKPIYEEYRRIGYRLRPEGAYKQTNIFDFLEEEEDNGIDT